MAKELTLNLIHKQHFWAGYNVIIFNFSHSATQINVNSFLPEQNGYHFADVIFNDGININAF